MRHLSASKNLPDSYVAEQIKNASRRKEPMRLKAGKDKCLCLLCGELLDPLTYVHAELKHHTTKQAMIDAGQVRFLNR